jgi:hypothetical protein
MAISDKGRSTSMIAGHFGFAAAVKSRTPSVPLWSLMLACQWLDVVFVPLLIAGVERLEVVPGAHQGEYGGAIIHADYTHSLVGALLLSAIFGVAAGLRYGRSSGVVLSLVSFSHWVLDLIVHRPDLPIFPGGKGGLPALGFGLWRSVPLAAGAELALVVIGAALYWRAARRVAQPDQALTKRANLCGAAVLASGLVTLGLNIAGM